MINIEEKITPYNTGFASGGVTCKFEAFYFYSILVQVNVMCCETCPNAYQYNDLPNKQIH